VKENRPALRVADANYETYLAITKGGNQFGVNQGSMGVDFLHFYVLNAILSAPLLLRWKVLERGRHGNTGGGVAKIMTHGLTP
jgi:hypothetical protein